MRKIPTLFVRDESRRLVTPAVTPGCAWVGEGLGTATRKLDGTCCRVLGGRLWKRYDMKPGKTPPPDFEQVDFDEATGKAFGWVPVGDGPEDRWHREAWGEGVRPAVEGGFGGPPPDWTYELIGPKIQGNPEGESCHKLVPHGAPPWGPLPLADVPRDFDGLRAYLAAHDIEGVVWWRDPADPDCDKTKIKGRDFGIKRGKRP